MGFGFFNWVSLFFDTRGIFSFWIFPQNKWLLVSNLKSNNFLCLSVCSFVFITLIISTQAQHLNTWWTLVGPDIGDRHNFNVSLCLWHILQLRVVCSLNLQSATDTFLFILQTFSCLHDNRNGQLVLCTFKWNIYYFIYKIKGNIGTVSHQIVQHIIQNDIPFPSPCWSHDSHVPKTYHIQRSCQDPASN